VKTGCRSRRTRGPTGQKISSQAIGWRSDAAETPARSLLARSPSPGGKVVRVGSRESANPVGTVAKFVVLSPRLNRGIRWSREAGSERHSDAAREARVALHWRRGLSGKGHDAGIRRRASEIWQATRFDTRNVVRPPLPRLSTPTPVQTSVCLFPTAAAQSCGREAPRAG